MSDPTTPTRGARTRARGPATAVAALGIATITSYGGWFYGFGVLVQPIADDTGWSIALLGGAWSAGQLLAGLGAVLGGRALDRAGGRRTFVTAGVVGGAGLGLAAVATQPWAFVVAFAVGAGVTGACGFYHVTMAAARRARVDDPGRGIAHLTVWGALASPVFLPLTAALVGAIGWRGAMGVLAATTVAGLVVAGVVVPDARAPGGGPRGVRPVVAAAGAAWAHRPTRRLVVAVCAGGFASGTVLAYQVPAMTAFGMPLAVASTVAGARGFAQLGGRVRLMVLVRRIGARRALAWAMGGALAATGLLLGASSVPVAVAFAALAGVSMGAASPLEGIHAGELLDADHLGALMGAMHTAGGVATAVGPLVGGLLVTATGSYRPAIACAGVAFAVAAVVLGHPDGRARPDRPVS